MGGTMKILTAEMHNSRKGPEAWFTGTVWLNEILSVTPPSRLKALRVWFAPNSRTAWHTHPVGQTLHVLDGLGLVQLAGQPPQIIRPGDTVLIAPQERHWHGAAPGRTMTHLAMQEADDHGSDVVWMEHVTDEEYGQPAI
jgi:quercetin dioxygenase-like cupin family protein